MASLKVLVGIIFYFVGALDQSADVIFLGTSIPLHVEQNAFPNLNLRPNINSIKRSVNKIDKYNLIANEYRRIKGEYNFNDWIYFKFVNRSINQILQNKSRNYKTFIKWWILGKSEYNVKLWYESEADLKIFIKSEDLLYGVVRKKDFYCFDCDSKKLLKPLSENFFNQGLNFDFRNIVLPKLDVKERNLNVEFYSSIDRNIYKIQYTINRSAIKAFHDYPKSPYLFDIPLSNEAYESLMPQLRRIISNKTKLEASQILLSFVRQTVAYKQERNDKWATPEETLGTLVGDCEDKSGLYYYLVKELLNLPVAIVFYRESNHVNVGLSLDDLRPQITFQNVDYSICETTDKQDKIDIGDKNLYNGEKFEVLKVFIPK